MARGCSVSLVTDAAQWEALFLRVEHPYMLQSWAYGEAKQAVRGADTGRRIDAGGWRVRRLVFERDGEPVAICQLFDKSLGGIRCVSRLSRGPLLLDADPGDDVIRDVYRALRTRQKHLRGLLVLAPALIATPDNHRLLAELGFRERHGSGWRSVRLDLGLDEERLRKNLAHTWRNRLGHAERAGAELRISSSPGDIDWIIDRHIENMREKGFSWPAPAFLRALYNAAPDNCLLLQARLADEAVGGMVVYRFGHGAEYYVGWMGSEGRRVNVGNFMFWHAALELRRRGCWWLDLGGKRVGATEPFKRGMRGAEYQLLNEWLTF